MAPLTIELIHVKEGGSLRVIMEVTALADIPKGVARFVVPEGPDLFDGQKTIDLGAMKMGETRTCEIVVDGAAVDYQLHAGVDAVFSDSKRLHSGRSLIVGTVPEVKSETTVIKAPGAQDGIRVEEVTPEG